MTALINDSTFLSSNGLLIDDVRFGVRLFTQLCYSHVKKEGNKVAHNLAEYDLRILDYVVWMEKFHHIFFRFSKLIFLVFLDEMHYVFPKKKFKCYFDPLY